MPTLKCDGWWEQAGYGRQPMNELIIEFSSRELTGSGEDIVGPFTLIGRIDDDRVFIQKQYLGQHWIDYHGTNSGEGGYYGDWSVFGYVGGKWSICVRSMMGETAAEMTEIVPRQA